MSTPGVQTYTVVGLWYGDDPVVAGVIEGEHGAVDSDPNDDRFRGRWCTSVEAADPGEAESDAVALMLDTLAAGDDDACGCGASLDDGEGYDGRCGPCADRAAIAAKEV